MSIHVTYDELKKMSKEFFDAANATDSLESLEAGHKCFGIAWLNCTFSDDRFGEIQREVEHPILFKIVSQVYLDNYLRVSLQEKTNV